MAAFIDVTGERYGKLVALEFVKRRKQQTMWRFRCDCGKDTIACVADVRYGRTASCSCCKPTPKGGTPKGKRVEDVSRPWERNHA